MTVAAEGTIYGGFYTGEIALRPDGSTIWQSDGRAERMPPSIGADGFLYMSRGALVRMSPSGAEETTIALQSNESAPLLAADGTIFVGGAAARAINMTGELYWQVDADTCAAAGYCFRSTSAMAPDGSLRFSAARHLYAIDRDGAVRWMFELPNSDGRRPLAVGDAGTTYICDETGLHAVDAAGREVFSYPGCAFAGPALAADGTVYLPGLTELIALSTDGSEVFRFPYGENRGSSPAVDSEGTIYIAAGYPEATLFAIEPSGREKWSLPLDRQARSPSIGLGRRLYLTLSAREPGTRAQIIAVGSD